MEVSDESGEGETKWGTSVRRTHSPTRAARGEPFASEPQRPFEIKYFVRTFAFDDDDGRDVVSLHHAQR